MEFIVVKIYVFVVVDLFGIIDVDFIKIDFIFLLFC